MTEVEKVNPYEGDNRSKKEQVAAMFDAIAPSYDFMNRAMTFGLDRLWLRALLKKARAAMPGDIIDLATGTGDVAFALADKLPKAQIKGLDISEGMLEKARRRAENTSLAQRMSFQCADCLATGLPNGCTDLITVAYGVRNFADIEGGYREMFRLLRPGGMLAVLELSRPVNPIVKAGYTVYTRALIPLVGRLVSGDSSAYSYLLDSIAAAPAGPAMCAIMERAGFKDVSFKRLTLGVCTLYTAYKKN